MKTWQVQVYKRQTWQQKGYIYNFNDVGEWIEQTEYELIDADYFVIIDGVLSFHLIEVYPENVQSLHGVLKTTAENRIAAYNANQWLSVSEWVEENDGST